MNRVALLACLVLAGCPKASVPEVPPPAPPPAQAVVASPPASEQTPPSAEAAPPAPSRPEPRFQRFDYKGQVLGEFTVDEFRKLHPLATLESGVAVGIEHWKLTKHDGLTIANSEVYTASYYFLDGKLFQVTLISVSKPDQVLSALREKYGPESASDDAGTYWYAKDGTLRFLKPDPDGSAFVVELDDMNMVEIAKSREAQKQSESTKANAKDL